MDNNDNHGGETIIVCQGCENECEVTVAFRDGKAVCLGGNNCPTGESFALSQLDNNWRKNTRHGLYPAL